MLQYLELPAQAAVVRPEAGIGFGSASGVPQNHRAGAEGGGTGAQHGDAVVAAAVGFAAGEPLHAPYGEALRLLPDTASQGGQRRRNRRQAVALLIPQPGRAGEAGFRSRPQRRQQGQRRQQVRDIRQVYLLRADNGTGPPLPGPPGESPGADP